VIMGTEIPHGLMTFRYTWRFVAGKIIRWWITKIDMFDCRRI
jgi:hypothetical protein